MEDNENDILMYDRVHLEGVPTLRQKDSNIDSTPQSTSQSS